MATTFFSDLETLNADFGSSAEGTAIITLDAPSATVRTIRVQIDADGLEDLTDIVGGIHVAHIHGQFEGNASRPLLEQGDGSFFDGDGGEAVDSVLPTIADSDFDGDGFINFLEGRPSYGPVVLNLTSTQLGALPDGSFPPEGVPPLTHFLNLAEAGEVNPGELFPSGTEFELDTIYTFDLTDQDQLRQYNNLTPINKREIVLHGLTVPLELSEAIDEAAMGTSPAGVDLNNGEAFRITAPVAAGTIRFDEPGAARSQFLALTDNNTLVSFDPLNPSEVESISLTGLSGTLLGIDTRPANGLIYGINTTDDIYTIDPITGAATLVSTLDTPFTGGTISGFDFNPVADRLRLVGGNDEDFRINVDTGAVTVDGTLAYAAGDVNAGNDPSITGAAYTNAIASSSSTQLYNIDEQLDILVLQNPPNDGTLMTVGELGIDFDTVGGFEIISLDEGSNVAYAVSNSTLYTIDLGTGTATNIGTIGNEDFNFIGLATVPKSAISPGQPDFNLVFGSQDDDIFDAPVPGGNFSGLNDIVFAGAGNNLVDTSTTEGDGKNRIYGGSDADEFFAGDNDRLFGGGGDDVIDILGSRNRAYGGEGNDEITLVEGSDNRLFGGEGNDILDATAGDGGNRLYGGEGDDTLFAGTGDTLVGGEGDDLLFNNGTGDNTFTGGAGADQFWIVNSNLDIITEVTTITDFVLGTDVIGLGGAGVTSFDALNTTEVNGNSLIALNGQDLAMVNGVTGLDAGSFAFA